MRESLKTLAALITIISALLSFISWILRKVNETEIAFFPVVIELSGGNLGKSAILFATFVFLGPLFHLISIQLIIDYRAGIKISALIMTLSSAIGTFSAFIFSFLIGELFSLGIFIIFVLIIIISNYYLPGRWGNQFLIAVITSLPCLLIFYLSLSNILILPLAFFISLIFIKGILPKVLY